MKIKTKGTGLIYFIFFLSGISALIYQVVWLRILIRILGCTVYATSIVLGAFMAGLALGSYFLGRYADRASHLLRIFAFLEFGVALSALIIPFVFDSLVPVYRWVYALTSGPTLSLVQICLVFITFIIPTTLMGGTLPVLSSFLAREESKFGSRIGSLYGINTLGAVLGVLGTGFVFLGYLGEFNTILIGVASNLCAATVAYYLDRKRTPVQPVSLNKTRDVSQKTTAETKISPYSTSTRRVIIVVFALSGFTALGYEVVWARILQLFLKTSIYAFSTMLIIYLIGIALGSLWGRKFVDRIKDPIHLFAVLEILIAFFSVLGLSLLVPMDSDLFKFVFPYFSNVLVAGVLIFPITLCLGILFPTVSRCFAKSEESVGESIGYLYSANTIGCVLGSLICGFLLIPLLGSTGTVLALTGINVLLGIILFLTDFQRFLRPLFLTVTIGGIACTTLMAATLQDPFYQIIKQRVQSRLHDDAEIYLHRENVTATITAFGSKTNPLRKHLWLNGVGMTSLLSETKLMAHLPILLCDDPQELLIVCFGMGTTLRSAVVYDNLTIDVVELIPDTYDAFKFYHHDGPQILQRPGVHHYVDDGRNFLLMREKSYDVITIDPAPPIYSAGTVNLYSHEFISLCRNRLNPGGVLCLWVPPGEYTEVRMIMRTFQSVFPHASLWRGSKFPGFYLIGTQHPLRVPLARFRQAFRNQKFLADINEWGNLFPSITAVTNLLLLNESELAEYLEGVPIITDNYPYTEFPLWRWVFDRDSLKVCDAATVFRWKEESKWIKNRLMKDWKIQ